MATLEQGGKRFGHGLRRGRLWFGIAAALIGAGAIVWLLRFDRDAIRATTGLVSHVICSSVFVSKLADDKVYRDTLRPLPSVRRIAWGLHYEIDRVGETVTTRFLNRFSSHASHHSGKGCLLLHEGAPSSTTSTVPTPAPVRLAEAVATHAAIDAILQRAIANPRDGAPNATTAIVVMHNGKLIAERYAPGYTRDTPLHGWSLSKSVVNAMIGALVLDTKLSISESAPVAEWRGASDPRGRISIDHLLRMTSGLDVGEPWERDIASRLLTLERDMASYAARAPLIAEPGTRWRYENGNTMILSRVIRDLAGGRAADVIAFAKRTLFDPLRMTSVTMEFDDVDTPVGTAFFFATARDWAKFGGLYLNDGVVDGRPLLPVGWTQYSSRRTLNSNYAAGFRLLSSEWRTRWQLPTDAFMATGMLGQYVLIVPSKNLVLSRFANAHAESHDQEVFGDLALSVLREIN